MLPTLADTDPHFRKKADVPFFEVDKSCVGKIVMGTGRTRTNKK